MKVLVIGSGAREHALVRACSLDPQVDAVLAMPGNPGIDQLALCLSVPLTDHDAVIAAAQEHAVDLTIIGPEAPLVDGLADSLRAAGLACFGPSAAAAALEGSKAFAKEVMAAAEVPTAMAHVCADLAGVEAALDSLGAPYVVKDDGLAAGKGVVVTEDRDQALAHAAQCLAAGSKLVIEEYLDGPEVSLFCISDGSTVIPLAPAQDFKRVFNGDEGPNTGGMGAYSPLPWAPADLSAQVIERVAQPVIAEMARRDTPFAGVLYVGLALTSRGLRVIEFNARFGDPETQVVLARLLTPISTVLSAAAQGTLAQLPELRWDEQSAVTVVIAAQNYPGAPVTGDPISGLNEVPEGAYVLHAGTSDSPGGYVSSGGRVLSVVGMGENLTQARERAYAGVKAIDLPGGHYRTDIALRASRGELG